MKKMKNCVHIFFIIHMYNILPKNYMYTNLSVHCITNYIQWFRIFFLVNLYHFSFI